jgi:anti-sigma28 factor (negative regulator of flagellin synthesis)
LDKFKDPSSHYHIPPGSRGPIDEEDHTSSREPSSLSSSSSTTTTSSSSSTSTPASQVGSLRESQDHGFEQSRVEALKMFRADGYDVEGTLEWPVAWGDCDMFQ